MEMNDQTKVQVLLAALGRRHQGIEAIRDRADRITVWTLGIFFVAAGWVVQRGTALSLAGKILFSVLILLALGVVVFYIRDLEKGFKSQFRVAVRIEKLLRLYDPGFFGLTGEELYPRVWLKIEEGAVEGHFFSRSYLLLCIGAAALIAAIASVGLLF